jgi:hypothetical protein
MYLTIYEDPIHYKYIINQIISPYLRLNWISSPLKNTINLTNTKLKLFFFLLNLWYYLIYKYNNENKL